MFATLTPEKIGSNLKRLIKESKYGTQENFAEAAGYNDRTVRRYIRRLDSISTITYVAKILDVDVMALLD